jgi:hypothetical protein
MAEIRLDTDELKRLAECMYLEVTDRIQSARRRIAATMDCIGADRPGQHGFSSIAGPKILQAAGQFQVPVARLEEAREKLVLAVRYFEEIDGEATARWERYWNTYPDWFRNRDLGMLLIMNLTADKVDSFYRYGNLLTGQADPVLPDLLVFLQREYDRIIPGTPEAELLLDLLDPYGVQPGTPEAELYLALVDIDTIQPDTPESARFVELTAEEYGLVFDGQDSGWTRWGGEPKWEMLTAAKAVVVVGRKFGKELNMTGSTAFKTVFGVDSEHPMTFTWDPKDEICNGSGGRCEGRRSIVFSSMTGSISKDDQKGINHVIHELGHAFSNYWISGGAWLPEKPDNVLNAEGYELRKKLKSDYGFYQHEAGCGSISTWRQHPPSVKDPDPPAGEYFADMFIGWVYDTWAPPPDAAEDVQIAAVRKRWMDQHMPAWIWETAGVPGS